MGICFPREHAYTRKGGCPDQVCGNLGMLPWWWVCSSKHTNHFRVLAVARATGPMTMLYLGLRNLRC